MSSEHKHGNKRKKGRSSHGGDSHRSKRQLVDTKRASSYVGEVGNKASVKKQKSEFICDIRLRNKLPPPPFEPKLLELALSEDRLLQYCSSSLEDRVKRPMIAEKFLSIPIDIIDRTQYNRPEGTQRGLLEKDKVLFVTSGTSSAKLTRGNRIKDVRGKAYSWLTKTTYLENNPWSSNKTVSQSQLDREEASRIIENKSISSRESQIDLIEATFEQARLTPVHPKKRHVKPCKIIDILPHPSLFKKRPENIAWLEFDKPLYEAMSESRTCTEDEAVGFMNNSLLVPHSSETLSIYAPNQPEAELPPTKERTRDQFTWIREFKQYPAPPVDINNNFVFFFGDETVYYNKYVTRANLRKRTQTKDDQFVEDEIRSRPDKYMVCYREEDPADMRRDMESDLFGDDEDDEEEEDAAAGAGNSGGGGDEEAESKENKQLSADLFGDDDEDGGDDGGVGANDTKSSGNDLLANADAGAGDANQEQTDDLFGPDSDNED